MKIKDVVQRFEESEEVPINEFAAESEKVGVYLNEMMERGKEILLNSNASEEILVKFFHAIRAKLVSSMVISGYESLLLCELSGDLNVFSDTFVFIVIGAFADEEII